MSTPRLAEQRPPTSNDPGTQAATPLREMTFRVGERAAQVDVHVVDRGDGNVHVAVRTGSSELSDRLQSEVPRLSQSLRDSGYDSEIWTPAHGTATHVERASEMQREDNNDNFGSSSGNAQHQQEQQQGRRDQDDSRMAEWQEQIDSLLPAFHSKGQHL